MFNLARRIFTFGGLAICLLVGTLIAEHFLTKYALENALEFTGLERTGIVSVGLAAFGVFRTIRKRRTV